MRATSATQFGWTPGDAIPPMEMISDGLWSVAVAMPDRHIFYSLCYLIIDDEGHVHIIDPGWGSEENLARLAHALSAVGKRFSDVVSIVCTHFHPDHMGLAEQLRAVSGAPIVVHKIEAHALESMQEGSGITVVHSAELDKWGVPGGARENLLALATASTGMPSAIVDSEVHDGARLTIPGWNLVVLHTAGHTSGHICLREPDRKLIFTGDHILPTIFSGIGLGGLTTTNPMADYLQGLDIVRPFDDHEVLPGHGYRFAGLSERCDAIESHHLRRSREVAAVLEHDPAATIWQVAEQATWTAGWENLKGFYQLSALRQTAMHVEFVQSAAGLARLKTSGN